MTTKHTPGPWRTRAVNADGTFVYCQILAPNNSPSVAGVTDDKVNVYRGDHAKANAEFIVRACNSHDALLAALEHALALLHTHVEPDALGGARWDFTDCPEVAPILAAIAAAKWE